MTKERNLIVAALEAAAITEIRFNKNDIPKTLPAAIVSLEAETGKNSTSKRYANTDISWVVHLIVNAHMVADPDKDLYDLKEAFRAQLVDKMSRDIPKTIYYDGRMDGARPVRIARLELLKEGSGAGS